MSIGNVISAPRNWSNKRYLIEQSKPAEVVSKRKARGNGGDNWLIIVLIVEDSGGSGHKIIII